VVDGQPRPLTLEQGTVPPIDEMRRGVGVIRLRAATGALFPDRGPHRLSFSNTHRSDIGVYLVNALIPSDHRIHITGQSRDMLQRQFKMDYNISAAPLLELALVWPALLSVGVSALFFGLARRFLNQRPS
jgi:hypothetical protein